MDSNTLIVEEQITDDVDTQDNTSKLYTLMDLVQCTIIDEDKTSTLSEEPVRKNLFDEIDLGIIKQKMIEIITRL